MAGQLIRPGKLFNTPGERAVVGFFACVGSYMAGLVFQPVEGLFTHGTFIRSV